MIDGWPWVAGTELRRREVHAQVGGQQQGGISTPKHGRDVLIFTDPAKGGRFGYDLHEGPQPDGSFRYTGAGQTGHQEMKRGNRAIADTAISGALIRLFTTKSTLATYVGSFTLGDPAYEVRHIPDGAGAIRRAFVFNLVPVDASTYLLDQREWTRTGIQSSDWRALDPSDFEFALVETESTRTVARIEFQLQNDFGDWLTRRGFPPQRIRIPVEGAAIQPDLYEPRTGLVVEAKKSPARSYLRQALGQVLDYDFCIRGASLPSVPALLFPSAPTSDLIALCDECEVGVIVREGDGFTTCGDVKLNALE